MARPHTPSDGAQGQHPASLLALHVGDLERIVSGDPALGRGRWEDRLRLYLRRLPYAVARTFDPQTLTFYTWREAHTYVQTYVQARAHARLPAEALERARAAAAPYRRVFAGHARATPTTPTALTTGTPPLPTVFLSTLTLPNEGHTL
jgi:hypothetical protein